MEIIKNIFKYNPFFTNSAKISEDFLKNRKIDMIRKDDLIFEKRQYKIFNYFGKIKNLQELNVKNSFDLLEYLKPCFVDIASDIETIKEEIKKEHVDNLSMYQNYYFYITFYLRIPDGIYFMGNKDRQFKKKFWFKDSLNGNELINYIKWEIDRLGISFMFATDTICFTINVKIYRSYEYTHRYLIEGCPNLNLNPKPI